MSIDVDCASVDSIEGPIDCFLFEEDKVEEAPTLWYGRTVSKLKPNDPKLKQITEVYQRALDQLHQPSNASLSDHTYHLIDVEDEALDELLDHEEEYAEIMFLTMKQHPAYKEFALAHPKDAELQILECKKLLKSWTKKVKKGLKKAGKAVEKCAKEVNDFIKEHKKEILIGVAVLAVAAGAYLVAGALTGGALGEDTPKRKEEEDDDVGIKELKSIGAVPPDPPREKDPLLEEIITTLKKEDKISANTFETMREESPGFATERPKTEFSPPTRSIEFPPLPNTFDSQEFLTSLHPQEKSPTSAFDSIDLSVLPFQQFLQAIQGSKPIFEPPNIEFGAPDPVTALPPSSPQHPLSQELLNGILLKRQMNAAGFSPFDYSYHAAPMLAKLREALNEWQAKRLEGGLSVTATRSCHVLLEGAHKPGFQISFINGMNTSFEEHKSHLQHIQKFAQELNIKGVYNHTNGAAIDVLEIFFLSYPGCAPVTADLLLENWTQFHEQNKDNPNAKFLQVTHSMGNILARDALMKAPKEIRDRVIILAIAPAIVIPEGLCYDSAHYASKLDIVPSGEVVFTTLVAAFNDEPEQQFLLENLMKSQEQLIRLEPHKEGKGIDHDFQSPTFYESLENHLRSYLQHGRLYKSDSSLDISGNPRGM